MQNNRKFRVALKREIHLSGTLYEFTIETVPPNPSKTRVFLGYHSTSEDNIVDALQEAYAMGYLDAAVLAAESKEGREEKEG